MLECRYLLSLSEDIIWDDLNNKLREIDCKLYNRCQKKLKKINILEKIGNTIIG